MFMITLDEYELNFRHAEIVLQELKTIGSVEGKSKISYEKNI